MPLITPDLTQLRDSLQFKGIVAAMIALKDMRYRQQIGRVTFLRRWEKLRIALFLTDDYQRMRQIVIARDKMCTRCGGQPHHVHHKIRVVDEPHRAVDPANGQALCVKCHSTHHRAKARVGTATPPTTKPALPDSTGTALRARSAPHPHPGKTA